MGQNFSSEPVVEKDTERDHNDTFNVAVSSCQGWRMSQEDNHSMILELPGEHKAAFFAVYDGHGSAKVSKHASESLWRHLTENELYAKGNFKEALEMAFLTFDREVNASYNAQLAGTTAICLLVVNNVIYCANIGDSRAVASVNCKCIPLSYDHKPENPQELKRILAAGGYVLGNRVNGNLALSRAFGDFHYKGNDQLPPEQQIVSPCPDVKTIELNDDVDFLVLACDGIWDVLTNEEVVEFVISRLEHQMEPGLICEQLTTRCLATDYELVIGCDNMTVLLVCYTRGRSWAEFCTDVFDKNSRRLGVSRTPPSIDPTAYPNPKFEVPQFGQVRDEQLQNEQNEQDDQQHQQQSQKHDKQEQQDDEHEQQQQSTEVAVSGETPAPNGSLVEDCEKHDDEQQASSRTSMNTTSLEECSKESKETTDGDTQCRSSIPSVPSAAEDEGKVELDAGADHSAKAYDSEYKQEHKNETDHADSAACNPDEHNKGSDELQSDCKEEEREDEPEKEQSDSNQDLNEEQNLECETK